MLEVPDLPVSLSPDSAPIITQPVTEQVAEITCFVYLRPLESFYVNNGTFYSNFQIPVETLSMATPPVDIPPPPPPTVFDSSAELASAVPTPVLTQPVTEQVVDAAPTAAEVLQAAAAEPCLADLGLGSYTPVGLIQNLLEFIHLDLGLPWWGAIVVGKQSLQKNPLNLESWSFFPVSFLILFFLFPVSVNP